MKALLISVALIVVAGVVGAAAWRPAYDYWKARNRPIYRLDKVARGRDILKQFLIESVVLSCVGGVIGVGLGIGASVGVTLLINRFTSGSQWPIVVSLPAAGVAMAFAAAVGVFFGFYPARRASRLDPIDALRYE